MTTDADPLKGTADGTAPGTPTLLDDILAGKHARPANEPIVFMPPTVIAELESVDDVTKLMPIIRAMLEEEAKNNGKRVYPRRLLRQQHIIAYMLVNPFATTTEICRFFGVTPSTLYNIGKSDTFKAMAAAHHVHMSNSLSADLEEQMKTTLQAAIEVTQRAVVEQQDPDFALSVLDKTANRLGMGAKHNTNVQINNNIVTPEMITAARSRRLGNAG